MIWRDTTARTMIGSMLVSSIGMGLYTLALGQTLFQHTGDAQAFAMIFALQGLGAVAVLPFSGPLVDAFDSKAVYVLCSLLRAVTVSVIVLALFTGHGGMVTVVGTAAVFLAVFDNVQRTAFFKFTAHHIAGDRAVAFNSLIGIAIQAGSLIGMAVLGLVLMIGTATQALLVDVAVSLVAALVVSRLRAPRQESAGRLRNSTLRSALPDLLRDWAGLFSRHRHEVVVFGMVLMCAGDFVYSYSLSTLVVPLVDAWHGGQPWAVSALEGTLGAGMIVATFFTRHTVRLVLLPVWVSLQAVIAAGLAFTTAPTLHYVGFFLAGFANLNGITLLLTLLQQHAGPLDKAKMASLRLLAIGLGTAALMPVLGLATRQSLAAAFLTVAALLVPFAACGVWAALRFRPRAADGAKNEAEPRPEPVPA
ncbi:MFS transporter [Streptomyces sp. NPDC001922]|uniref:MFS transporter n=1 Tax=Streptomyces sp. NPDC001922 TaxID=3364624 RepID=UPI00368F8FB0